MHRGEEEVKEHDLVLAGIGNENLTPKRLLEGYPSGVKGRQ